MEIIINNDMNSNASKQYSISYCRIIDNFINFLKQEEISIVIFTEGKIPFILKRKLLENNLHFFMVILKLNNCIYR